MKSYLRGKDASSQRVCVRLSNKRYIHLTGGYKAFYDEPSSILRSRQAREKRCQTDNKKAKTPLRQSWDTFGIGQ